MRRERNTSLADSLLKSKGCVHVGASLRRFTSTERLESLIQVLLCRKGWKRYIQERKEIWIEIWLAASRIFQGGGLFQKTPSKYCLPLRSKWITQWVLLSYKAKIFYSGIFFKRKKEKERKSIMVFRKIYNHNSCSIFQLCDFLFTLFELPFDE